MMFTTEGNQVKGKLLTLLFFWMLKGKQKQQETQQVISASHFLSQRGLSMLSNHHCKLLLTVYQLTSLQAILLFTHLKSRSHH